MIFFSFDIYCSIETPQIQHVGPVCVEFYYHMHGDAMGTLRMKTLYKERTMWARAGPQGNKWIKAAVTVNVTNKADRVSKI